MLKGPINAPSADHNSIHSSLRESIVGHIFVGEVLRYLWLRGLYGIELLHPAIDQHGYDVVMRLGTVTRHIQLKTLGKYAKTSKFKIQTLLAEKESGCALLITIDPDSLELGPYLYFGGKPGEPLSSLNSYRTAKHSKGDSNRLKAERPRLRSVPKGAFEKLSSIAEVAQMLFGVETHAAAEERKLPADRAA